MKIKIKHLVLILGLIFVSFTTLPVNANVNALAHEGHFNVNVGDQYEFVWTSLKDSEGDPITDGSYGYPDAQNSNISEGDHFYLTVDKINMTDSSPSIYGNFTFANGNTLDQVALMGYFKTMNSTEYNWTYWETYYTDPARDYTVTITDDYFEYATSDNASDLNLMRFRWEKDNGVMLAWELHGVWIQMMGFGTVSEIIMERYESVADYGVSVGDKIHLIWATLLDSDGNEVNDSSYSYPDAPDSNISEGDTFYIEITTINTSMMGTTVYGQFIFGEASSPEVILMGYVKSREWNHFQLYYASRGYIVTNNGTHFGYQSGSTMGGPLLKMLWGRSTGVMEEFWLKGYWIQMMGFGTPSEIKLTLDSIEYYVEPTTTTEPVSTTTTTTTTTTTEGRTPGFEFPIFLMAFVTVSIMFTRRRKP